MVVIVAVNGGGYPLDDAASGSACSPLPGSLASQSAQPVRKLAVERRGEGVLLCCAPS